MLITFEKKSVLPDGKHDMRITSVTDVDTVNGKKLVINLTPINETHLYQDVQIWLSEKEDTLGVAGVLISRLTEYEAKNQYSTGELKKLLEGVEVAVKTKRNSKEKKVYVNVTQIIDIYEDDEDEAEEGIDDDDDDLGNTLNKVPGGVLRHTRRFGM